MMRAPAWSRWMLCQPEPACLPIADISGYTSDLAGAELVAHHGLVIRHRSPGTRGPLERVS
jgi:hypothetical protein